ncbi:hypothetical protein LBMAG42_23270 [Deltaproteobacteria bacterium]|nr:hypothetical protein LBMAG42_23270 [Deltaproteobacteria bacterium]
MSVVLHLITLWLCGCPLISDADLDSRLDVDGDGVPRPSDCDDEDPEVGAAATLFADADGDGVGSDAAAAACSTAEGFVAVGGDCDDTRADVSPASPELCDGVDNDCDGASDENDAANVTTWYSDRDNDGYGVDTDTVASCLQIVGYAALPGDCDDEDGTVNPGIREVCDGRDEDCSGAADDPYWWLDADGDAFGRDDDKLLSCASDVAGRAPAAGDCDDANKAINPAADERCDDADVDEDCDGLADDDDTFVVGATPAYLDGDGDGYGTASSALPAACELASGYSRSASDCDDSRSDVSPAATEVCYDGLDQNCDAVNDDDCDADGSLVADDCDDANPYVSPLRDEACGDDVDNDCDGEIAGNCHLFGEVPLDDADAVIAGHRDGDSAGRRIEGVGDTNGDGYDDIVVTSDSWGTYAGRSVVLHGPLAGDYNWDTAGFAVEGCAAYDNAYSLSRGGDLDGDGREEWAVGAFATDVAGGGAYDGAVYLMGDDAASLCDVTPAIAGDGGAYLGQSVAGGADFSGDGVADIAATFLNRGAYNDGEYVFFGGLGVFDALVPEGAASIDEATFVIDRPEDAYTFGSGLELIGDLDGDGASELLVTDYGASVVTPNDGAAYVFLGGQTGTVSAADAHAVVYGDSSFGNVYAGFRAGDLDGDGREDLLVQADLSEEVSGVFAFASLPAGETSINAATTHIGNEGTSYSLGYPSAGAGDVNGDGRDDLLLLSSADSRLGFSLGAALLYFGPLVGSFTELDCDAALYDDYGGSAVSSMSGGVAGAGDTNGDGFDDILVSDGGDYLYANRGGLTWLFLGGG